MEVFLDALCNISTPCLSISSLHSLFNCKAKGHVWHKSSMKKRIVSRSGIDDTDARWGFSHTKGWMIFGYKLHLISSIGSIIVPLAADFTTANIPDNQIYNTLIASLPVTTSRKILYVSADPGYNDHEMYELSYRDGISVSVSSKEI